MKRSEQDTSRRTNFAFSVLIKRKQILEKIFGLIPRFKSKDDMLEEEFAKFVADYKPEESDAIPAIKNYFKAYVTSDQIRHIDLLRRRRK